jgi:hypothetical protein
MAVNDGDQDGGNGEGRGHIGRRQEGRKVVKSTPAEGRLSNAGRNAGGAARRIGGERGVWVEERGTIGL